MRDLEALKQWYTLLAEASLFSSLQALQTALVQQSSFGAKKPNMRWIASAGRSLKDRDGSVLASAMREPSLPSISNVRFVVRRQLRPRQSSWILAIGVDIAQNGTLSTLFREEHKPGVRHAQPLDLLNARPPDLIWQEWDSIGLSRHQDDSLIANHRKHRYSTSLDQRNVTHYWSILTQNFEIMCALLSRPELSSNRQCQANPSIALQGRS